MKLFKKIYEMSIFLLTKIECVSCGSYFVQTLGLCEYCENKVLIHHTNPQRIQSEDTTILSLFDWTANCSDDLSGWIKSLKSRCRFNEWRLIAEFFIKQHDVGFDAKTKVVFIPIPSSTGRSHSIYFAKELAQQLNKKYCNYLKISQEVEQKSLNLNLRKNIKFEIHEEFTNFIKSHDLIVFVDDVTTSGSSYRAAHSLVSKKLQKTTQLWAAFRRLL